MIVFRLQLFTCKCQIVKDYGIGRVLDTCMEFGRVLKYSLLRCQIIRVSGIQVLRGQNIKVSGMHVIRSQIDYTVGTVVHVRIRQFL